MEHFKQEDIEKVNSELELLNQRYSNLLNKLWDLTNCLKEEKAKEYLFHGAARRLRVIQRCIENIFTIFPLKREKLLDRNELDDVMINLHAFLINIFGLLDNLAWSVIHEKRLADKIHKEKVSLFKKETKKKFSSEFRKYLDSGRIKTWYNNYLINYRDALSHRIPLYVPPKMLTPAQNEKIQQMEKEFFTTLKSVDTSTKVLQLLGEMDNVGSVAPYFIHSFSESESKYVAFHVQVIADFKTIEEIIEKFCETFEKK